MTELLSILNMEVHGREVLVCLHLHCNRDYIHEQHILNLQIKEKHYVEFLNTRLFLFVLK